MPQIQWSPLRQEPEAPYNNKTQASETKCTDKEISWGYSIPYMITGILNRHPDMVMKLADSKNEKERHGFLKFYETLTEEEVED